MMNKLNSTGFMARSLPLALCVGAVAFHAVAGVSSAARLTSSSIWTQTAEDTKDVVVLTNGRSVEGKILEETETTVRMMVRFAGIEAERSFDKGEILKITRDVIIKSKPSNKSTARSDQKSDQKVKASKVVGHGENKVYRIVLDGVFGEDITQTPIRAAVRDAKKYDVDYLIVEMDNDWSQALRGGLAENDLPDDIGAFDELFRAEDMDPVFTEDIPREWEKQPTLVFWVKSAMGGAAFLPLNSPKIYFSSDARLGGIGNLGNLFGSMGDEVVRQKQYSLRRGHAEGMAIRGGYEPRLIKAMSEREYVLSYKIVGGKAEFFERMPEAGERLLTDDGEGANADTIQELARSQGNDVLTLDADTAYDIGVSKGTVDTFDDLLYELDIARNYTMIDGKSEDIMDGWSEGLAKTKRTLRKLMREYGQIQVRAPGGYRERTRARGQRKSKLEEVQRLVRRYEEALTRRWLGQNGIPGDKDIDILKERIKLEQMQDRK